MDDLDLRVLNHIRIDINNNRNFLLTSRDLINVNNLKKLSSDEILRYNLLDKNYLHFYENWYSDENKIYYLKRRSRVRHIVNELLGEYISIYMNLPTIRYSIAIENNEVVGVISENFRKDNFQYILAPEYDIKIKRYNKNSLKNKNKIPLDYRKTIASYLITNIYTSIKERNINSMIIKKEHDYLIAPLFDYESAFSDWQIDIYEDPMFSRNIKISELGNLFIKNPYFEEAYKKIMDLDIIKILSVVSRDFNFDMPEELINYYCVYDELRKEKIKKLIKK